MASEAIIEKNVYEQVRASPFTVINGEPSWRDAKILVQEAREAAMGVSVSYDWAGNYGLLAEIEGAAQYLTTSGGEIYVPQVKPMYADARLVGTQTAADVRTWTSENDEKKRNWAASEGFRKAFGENWRDCLPPRYWEQLEEAVFVWKNISPRQYVEHLQDVWITLDEPTIEKERDNYKRGWSDDKHITLFRRLLDLEQVTLMTGKIVISNESAPLHA